MTMKHLCSNNRHRNYFKFDFERTFTYQRRTKCESEGQCIQDIFLCPSSIICICVPESESDRTFPVRFD
jgi:hypothetical protein